MPLREFIAEKNCTILFTEEQKTMKKIPFFILFAFSLLITGNIYSQRDTMSKTFLNHIALYITDLKKSGAFYSDIIGLDTIPEPFHDGKHIWYSIGPKSHLHLIEGAAYKPE